MAERNDLVPELKKFCEEECKKDEYFKVNYSEKHLVECCSWIAHKVYELKACMVSNEIVFNWCKEFFIEREWEKHEIKIEPYECISSNHELTEEDKRFIEEESNRLVKEKKELELKEKENVKKNKVQAQIDKEVERKMALAKKEEEEKKASGQLSLFDL